MNDEVNYAKIQRIQDDLEALTIGTFGTGFVTDAMLYESGIKATVAQHTSDLADIVTNVKSFGAKGDGTTDDTAAIRSAYSATPTGSTLYFPPGTYMVKADSVYAPVINATKSIKILGAFGSLLKNLPTAPTGTRIIQVSSNDTEINNIVFDANGISSATCIFAINASKIRVVNNKFYNPSSGALCIDSNVSDVIFSKNHIEGKGYGVLVNDNGGNKRISVVNNTFIGSGSNDADAIEFNGVNNDIVEVVVSNNTIYNYIGGNTSTGFGIACARVVGGTIMGNTINTCSRNGIHIECLSKYITVEGNYVTNCNNAGIEVQGESQKMCEFIVINGNSVKDCALSPSNNLGRGGIDVGISVSGSFAGFGARSITITNNSISHCQGAGIYMFQSTDSIIMSNHISNTYGNSTDTSTAIHNTAIYIISGDRSLIALNKIVDTQGTQTQYYPVFYYGSAVGIVHISNVTTGNLAGVTDATSGVSKALEASVSSPIRVDGGNNVLGFYGTTPISKPTVSGSSGGNAALQSLISSLATLGIITNSTT